jgi:hypothetical protein
MPVATGSPRRSASVRISSSAPAAAMSGPTTSKGFSALSSASQIAWIDARVRHQAHVRGVRGLDQALHIGGFQRGAAYAT